MLIQLEVDRTITSDDILHIIEVYLKNPYPVKTSKQKKQKNKSRLRIEITDDDYFRIKTINPQERVDSVILTLLDGKYNELYYGSILFYDKNLWKREVIVKNIGRIDGLNKRDKIIVELKFFNGWKSALGQILSYSVYYPDYKKEIWLLMDKSETQSKKDAISNICQRYNTSVKLIDLNNKKDVY